MARLGADARRRGVPLPRPARRLGHGRAVARDGSCRRDRPRCPRDRGERRRGATRGRARASARSSSPISACCATLGDMRRAGELPESLVLKTSVLLPCANPATARDARSPGRDDDQRVHGPVGSGARGAPRRVHGAARRLRRGSRRPGRVRALLRRPRDRAHGRARLRQARAAQRSEHLSVRPAPRGSRGEARTRARAARRARPPSARGASAGARRGPGRRSARPTSGSRSRERPLRGDLHGRARGHPRRARASTIRRFRPSIRPLERGTRLAGPAYTVKGGPATNPDSASYDEAIRKVLAMLGDVPGGTRRRLRLRPGRVRAPRRAVRDVAEGARRRRLRPRRRLPRRRASSATRASRSSPGSSRPRTRRGAGSSRRRRFR